MKKLFTICALSAFLFTACDDDSASATSDEPVSSSAVKNSAVAKSRNLRQAKRFRLVLQSHLRLWTFVEAIAKVPSLVECYFKLGIEKCMERYNGK